MINETHNPDVLNCLANLSSDEVFTSPKITNEMLDMLPQELFENPNTTFLDPCTKSGVFLREIAKRLLVGLEKQIPDLQQRINHIFTKQLYGIAITQLTSLLSRRSVYCSKTANGKYSIVDKFTNDCGNINFSNCKHVWNEDFRCEFCNVDQTKETYSRNDMEVFAYEFIHTHNPQEIFNMKFDVIIGNPPYQLNVGNTSGNSSKAKAIYHLFVSQAMKLQPRYLTMIIPSRWMTRSTEGIPDEWVDEMLDSKHIRNMHDYLDAALCFPGVEIKGGVCYFLWDRDNAGDCLYNLHDINNIVSKRTGNLDFFNAGIVIRDNNSLSILNKIQNVEGQYINNDENNFSGIVSPKDFYTNKKTLTSSWKGFNLNKESDYNIKYYLNRNIHKTEFAWVKLDDISKNQDTISKYKVYIPAAGGTGNDEQVLGRPFVGDSNSVCSQTYLVIGYNKNYTKEQCANIVSYIKTRFFRYLVSIKKKTQNGPRMVYQFVPMQDFNESWTDEKLYKKYNLTQEEIAFIESMIKPME